MRVNCSKVFTIKKVFFTQISNILSILNVIICTKNIMEDIFIILSFTVLKLKNIMFKEKKKEFGSIEQRKVLSILVIHPLKNK